MLCPYSSPGPLGLAAFFLASSFFPSLDASGSISFGDDGLYKVSIEKSAKSPSDSVISAETKTVTMFNRKGMPFVCSLPPMIEPAAKQNQFNVTMAQIKAVLAAGDPKLPPGKNCVQMLSNGWWHYEYCFSKKITQFHIEASTIVNPIISLGHFSHDFDWSQLSPQDALKKTDRTHIQYFTNGSECDLTGKRRSTRVKLYCNPNTQHATRDYILKVDEPESCVYEVTVLTSRLCQIEYFNKQPPQVGKILCKPIVQPEETQESPSASAFGTEETAHSAKLQDKTLHVDENDGQERSVHEDDYDHDYDTDQDAEARRDGTNKKEPLEQPLKTTAAKKKSFSSLFRQLSSKERLLLERLTAPPKSRAKVFADVLAEMHPAHQRMRQIEKMIASHLGANVHIVDVEGAADGGGVEDILKHLGTDQLDKLQAILTESVVGQFGGLAEEEEAAYALEDNYKVEEEEDEKRKDERVPLKIELLG